MQNESVCQARLSKSNTIVHQVSFYTKESPTAMNTLNLIKPSLLFFPRTWLFNEAFEAVCVPTRMLGGRDWGDWNDRRRLIFGTSIRRVKMFFKKVPPVHEYVSVNGLNRQGLLKLEKAIFKCIPCRVQVFPAMSYNPWLNHACNSPIGKTSAKSANLEALKLTEHDGHDN